VERDKPSLTNTALPLLRFYMEEKGGKNLVDGWSPENWSSFGDYIREGFDQDTLVHPSFNSAQETLNFMSGIGEYSDRNSFFYNGQDHAEFRQEGYFQSVQCPECLEDLKSQLEEDSMPEEDLIDPEIYPVENEYKGRSFKPEEEKYVKELWYQCRNHPEVSLMKRDTWYE